MPKDLINLKCANDNEEESDEEVIDDYGECSADDTDDETDSKEEVEIIKNNVIKPKTGAVNAVKR